MGGGPRTFPGGLSKWQYKRMHEKLARQKQRGLLRHEKQLYLARLRSEIRASRLPGAAAEAPPGGEGPTSSRAHIRALADRFRRPGAEDLWNEDDGPRRTELGGPDLSGSTEAFRQGKRADLGRVQSEKRVPNGGGALVPALGSATSRFRCSQKVLSGDDSLLRELPAMCRPEAIGC
jgi:hypothetical protein